MVKSLQIIDMRVSRAIEQTLVVNAAPEAVFRALTDARELERWWTSAARSEPRAGGRFRYEWSFEKAPERDHVQEGAYLDVVPARLLRYPWAAHGAARPTLVSFALAPEAGGTRVELVHSGWPIDAGMDGILQAHVEGWAAFLGNLKNVLEGGRDARREAMGLVTRA